MTEEQIKEFEAYVNFIGHNVEMAIMHGGKEMFDMTSPFNMRWLELAEQRFKGEEQ